MRILIVNKFLYFKGGSEKYSFELADLLRKNGHSVAFFGMESDKDIIKENFPMVKNMDLRKSVISSLSKPFKAIYSFEARQKIRRALKVFSPDVVHLNNYNYQLTPSILYEIKKMGVPIVQTVHDSHLVCPNHRLSNYYKNHICELCSGGKFINCTKTRCIQNSFPKSIVGTLEAFFYKLMKTYHKKVDLFIYPSHFMKKKQNEMGFSPSRAIVLPNFVGEILEKPLKDEGYVLYFGRISQDKGIGLLLDVVAKTPHIQYVFAGTGPLVPALSDYTNIDYKGFVTGSALSDLIKKARFSILPSVYYDNCPLTILESYQYGTPVIGTDLGGISELIKDGITGCLFKNGDAGNLKSKIELLYSDTDLIEKLSENCIGFIRNFSSANYYDVLISHYTDIMGGEIDY